jgi:hypothetical protein
MMKFEIDAEPRLVLIERLIVPRDLIVQRGVLVYQSMRRVCFRRDVYIEPGMLVRHDNDRVA